MTNWLVKKGGCDVRDIVREEVGYIDVWRQKRVGYAENLKTNVTNVNNHWQKNKGFL